MYPLLFRSSEIRVGHGRFSKCANLPWFTHAHFVDLQTAANITVIIIVQLSVSEEKLESSRGFARVTMPDCTVASSKIVQIGLNGPRGRTHRRRCGPVIAFGGQRLNKGRFV